MAKLEKNHIEINGNNEYSQTGIRCCNKPSVFTITYDVAGVNKIYSVCKSCSKLNCFSQFIVQKVPVENDFKIKNKNFENTESNEIADDIIENGSENNEHHPVFAEHNEHGTSIVVAPERGEN